MSDPAVLAALIRVHARDGRATIRSVATEAGRDVGWVHHQLRELAAEGLASDSCELCVRVGCMHECIDTRKFGVPGGGDGVQHGAPKPGGDR